MGTYDRVNVFIRMIWCLVCIFCSLIRLLLHGIAGDLLAIIEAHIPQMYILYKYWTNRILWDQTFMMQVKIACNWDIYCSSNRYSPFLCENIRFRWVSNGLLLYFNSFIVVLLLQNNLQSTLDFFNSTRIWIIHILQKMTKF